MELLLGPKKRGKKATSEQADALYKAVMEAIGECKGAKEVKREGKVGGVFTVIIEGQEMESEETGGKEVEGEGKTGGEVEGEKKKKSERQKREERLMKKVEEMEKEEEEKKRKKKEQEEKRRKMEE